MSHSQFHCTGRVYLDLHGLIFETSICYWQDQPGSPLATEGGGGVHVRGRGPRFSLPHLPRALGWFFAGGPSPGSRPGREARQLGGRGSSCVDPKPWGKRLGETRCVSVGGRCGGARRWGQAGGRAPVGAPRLALLPIGHSGGRSPVRTLGSDGASGSRFSSGGPGGGGRRGSPRTETPPGPWRRTSRPQEPSARTPARSRPAGALRWRVTIAVRSAEVETC